MLGFQNMYFLFMCQMWLQSFICYKMWKFGQFYFYVWYFNKITGVQVELPIPLIYVPGTGEQQCLSTNQCGFYNFCKGSQKKHFYQIILESYIKFRRDFFFKDWQFFGLSNAAATKVWPHLAQFRICPMLDGDKCSDKRSIKLDTKCNLYTVNPFPHWWVLYVDKHQGSFASMLCI